MPTSYRRDLERLRYWQGQTLRSSDARDQGRFDALRRQLHNRALHSTGGIAFGLAVQSVGDRFEVECGLAYDARGRELILQRTRRAPQPRQAGWLVLRLRANAASASSSSSCCLPSSDSGCTSEGAPLLEDNVELAWVVAATFEPSSGVALARFDGAQLDPDFAPRQARPLARPRLARGETVQGDTPWEPWTIERPDGKGGIALVVVGVQTHIDTSASGFTQTPRYVANLQTRDWDLSKAEFAPAFFPHVADPSVDGFTFRLLMTEIARRRYSAWFGTARVVSTTRGVGDRLVVEVDDAAAFKERDVIAQLRPRARSAVALSVIAKTKLTLAAPLAQIEAGTTLLAVGNLPRVAVVTSVVPEDPAMLATHTATPPVKKGDLLQRMGDGALAAIDRVSQGVLTVGHPFAGWKAADPLLAARMTGLAEVKSAMPVDGGTLSIELKSATHGAELGLSIVLLDAAKKPLATVPKVTARNGATILVQPLPSAAEIANIVRIVPLTGGIAVQGLESASHSTIGVDTVGPFAVGDFVASPDAPGQIAVIEEIDADEKQLTLSTALPVAPNAVIAAANWQCATTIGAFAPQRPQEVVVGRADAARVGDFLALRATEDFGAPTPVTAVSGKLLSLAAPLAGATRLDTLAVGRFPRIATVVQQQQDAQFTIAEAGALVAGDCVMVLPSGGAVAAEAPVVQVAVANGTAIVLAESLGPLDPGDKLAVVHWRDSVRVKTVDAGQPTRIEVDRDPGFRENDVVGLLTHHADVSNGGYIDKIEGNLLTLWPGLDYGDGIVDQDWIDGGLVGPAAVSFTSSSQMFFPAPWQPLVRMLTLDGLDSSEPATAYGLDLLTGVFQSRTVLPQVYEPANSQLLLYTPGSNEAYRFRPETLSLITRFNTDFPRAFATFAQKQQLVVRWIGCQQEFPPAAGCPGQQPHDPCPSGVLSE